LRQDKRFLKNFSKEDFARKALLMQRGTRNSDAPSYASDP